MTLSLTSLAQVSSLGFDDIIDVRSPAEFADDHIPGAINLPVLDNAERAEIGTIYKQVSPFQARKRGAALVAANAARHLLGPLADKPGGWQPLIYCWRGGQRSGSFASILSQIGWRVELVAGGYKSWRALVVNALYDQPFPCRVVILDGNTGSAKTALLSRLAARDVQVIDLEGIARHRGSLFGAMPDETGKLHQPSQKSFETDLAMTIAGLDPARLVVVEAESSKVGNCRLPPSLWKAMSEAPRLSVAAPVSARAAYLVRAYGDMIEDPDRLARTIDRLRGQHAHELVDHWQNLKKTGAYEALAAELMQHHYDPRYTRHRARMGADFQEFSSENLDDAHLNRLTDRLQAALTSL